jgi:hypothetical protein
MPLCQYNKRARARREPKLAPSAADRCGLAVAATIGRRGNVVEHYLDAVMIAV